MQSTARKSRVRPTRVAGQTSRATGTTRPILAQHSVYSTRVNSRSPNHLRLDTKTTQARVSMVCSMRDGSWPPHDEAQIPHEKSQTCDLVCSMRAKIHMTVLFDAKSGSKIEGTPHEGGWSNQSGYRYHSVTFSSALGALHGGQKLAASISRG